MAAKLFLLLFLASFWIAIAEASRRLQDRQGCLSAIEDSDGNGDGRIDASEYLDFCHKLGLPQEFTETPLSLQTTFSLLACYCKRIAFADDDCCDGENAHLSVLWARLSDAYLSDVCVFTVKGIEAATGSTDAPSSSPESSTAPAPTKGPTLRPTTSPTPTPTPDPTRSPTPGPTRKPKTEAPTSQPTTQSSTTEAPVTLSPTISLTESPVTKSPTQGPVTESPFTASPTTLSPTTLVPITMSPTSSPSSMPKTIAPATPKPTTLVTMSPTVFPLTSMPSVMPVVTKAPTNMDPPTNSPTTTFIPATNSPSSVSTVVPTVGRVPVQVDILIALAGDDPSYRQDLVDALNLLDFSRRRYVRKRRLQEGNDATLISEAPVLCPASRDASDKCILVTAQLMVPDTPDAEQNLIQMIEGGELQRLILQVNPDSQIIVLDAASVPEPTPVPSTSGGGSSTGVVVGAVIGSLCVVGIVGYGVAKWSNQRRRGHKESEQSYQGALHSGESRPPKEEGSRSGSMSSGMGSSISGDSWEEAEYVFSGELHRELGGIQEEEIDLRDEKYATRSRETDTTRTTDEASSGDSLEYVVQARAPKAPGGSGQEHVLGAYEMEQDIHFTPYSLAAAAPASDDSAALGVGVAAGTFFGLAGAAAAARKHSFSDDSSPSVTKEMENQFLGDSLDIDSQDFEYSEEFMPDPRRSIQFDPNADPAQVGATLVRTANIEPTEVDSDSSTDSSSSSSSSDDDSTSSSSSSSSSSTEVQATQITNYDPEIAGELLISAASAPPSQESVPDGVPVTSEDESSSDDSDSSDSESSDDDEDNDTSSDDDDDTSDSEMYDQSSTMLALKRLSPPNLTTEAVPALGESRSEPETGISGASAAVVGVAAGAAGMALVTRAESSEGEEEVKRQVDGHQAGICDIRDSINAPFVDHEFERDKATRDSTHVPFGARDFERDRATREAILRRILEAIRENNDEDIAEAVVLNAQFSDEAAGAVAAMFRSQGYNSDFELDESERQEDLSLSYLDFMASPAKPRPSVDSLSDLQNRQVEESPASRQHVASLAAALARLDDSSALSSEASTISQLRRPPSPTQDSFSDLNTTKPWSTEHAAIGDEDVLAKRTGAVQDESTPERATAATSNGSAQNASSSVDLESHDNTSYTSSTVDEEDLAWTETMRSVRRSIAVDRRSIAFDPEAMNDSHIWTSIEQATKTSAGDSVEMEDAIHAKAAEEAVQWAVGRSLSALNRATQLGKFVIPPEWVSTSSSSESNTSSSGSGSSGSSSEADSSVASSRDQG